MLFSYALLWHFWSIVTKVLFLYAQTMKEKLRKLLDNESIKDIPIIYVVRILIALEEMDVS